MITKHPIYQDFPEYTDKIKDLYHNNDEFQVLLHSYTELDEKIYKIEKDEELAMDDEFKIENDPILSYRNYYKKGKAHLHTWTKQDKPQWLGD